MYRIAGILLLTLLSGVGPLRASPPTDEEFLRARLTSLAARYGELARRQSEEAIRARTAALRELEHLPFATGMKEEAAAFLATVLEEDRAYRVRAEAAHALGRLGTPGALRRLTLALFGEAGRRPSNALLHRLFPLVVSRLRDPADQAWIVAELLRPAAHGPPGPLLGAAGTLRDRLIEGALEGCVTLSSKDLIPSVTALATEEQPRGIRIRALHSLALLAPGGSALLADASRSQDPALRAAVAHGPLAPDLLAPLLVDADESVRAAALRGLARRPAREAIPALISRLRDEAESTLALEAEQALTALTGRDFGLDHELWSAWWSANTALFEGPVAGARVASAYFFDVGLRTRRVLFVVDTSGSMSREDATGLSRLDRAAAELSKAIAALPPATRFGLIAFAGEVRRYAPSEHSIEHASGRGSDRSEGPAAAAWLRALKPAGPSSSYAALMEAVGDPLRPDAILFLSDGIPFRCTWKGRNYSEPEQILAEVRESNPDGRIRVHAVALMTGGAGEEDDEAAARFLARLAAENRGEFREVR